MRKIIHIGLGKTGTTYLQSNTLPLLDKIGLIDYRRDLNIKLKKSYIERKVFHKSSHKKIDLNLENYSDNSIQFISCESLLSWDPRDWEESIKEILIDFGEDSEILITLRDPYSYLRSIYQQVIQQGESDLKPEYYFLRSELYDKHRDYFARSNYQRRFSIDDLNFKYLFMLES